MNFFAYGSLINQTVWKSVVKNNYKSIQGFLTGYSRKYLKGEEYPGIIKNEENSSIEGLIYFQVNEEDMYRLDLFEGEYYKREIVLVQDVNKSSYKCFTYLLKKEYQYLLTEKTWTYEEFQKTGLSVFLEKYKGWNDI